MNATAEASRVSFRACHRRNIAASLAHRLEAARAANNTRLLELLEQEQRQLAAESSGRDPSVLGLPERWRHLWEGLKAVLSVQEELRVRQWVDGGGTVWWHAQDPLTGECLCTPSEQELMDWIEKHSRNG
ncbi:hypothetical protein NW841_07795 [Synechococcus sp. H60.3]|uniref:hypothetical protein n=1 Tax=unclassified Synechococcus TaxID=2626047 RepID=UPI0039C1F0D0